MRQTVGVSSRPVSRMRLLTVVAAVFAMAGIGLLSRCDRESTPVSQAAAPPDKSAARASEKPNIASWSKRFIRQEPAPTELRPDPGQTAGSLENGLRYVVMESPGTPGEVSLRLLVLAGSMHEEEPERGFAHFVEHLAFEGTAGRPGELALDSFERLGLTAGADSNAHTARDHTLYRLDLPVADEGSLEMGFGFFRRIADGLDFSASVVDAERLVVLREMDERKESRGFSLRTAALLPEVRAAKQSPIGLQETIEQATPEGLRGFWHRHYVPERMVIVATGDLTSREMIGKISRHFESLPAREAPAEPGFGDPLANDGKKVVVIPHDDTEWVRITLAVPQPIDQEADGPAKRHRELVRTVSLQMLENRLRREYKGNDATGNSTRAASVELVPGIGWAEVSASISPRDLERGLPRLLTEWRRALEHGFEPREFAEARGEVRHAVRLEFLERLENSTAGLATALADGVRTGRIVELPEDGLNLALSDLAGITREECETSLRHEWETRPPRLLLSGAVTADYEAWTAYIVEEAASNPPMKLPAAAEIGAWTPKWFGMPGSLVRQELDAERGFLEAEFANRVVVRLVPMSSLGGFVRVRVHVGHGVLSAPSERPGLATAASILCRWHPVESWKDIDLNASLAEENVSRSFNALGDTFAWTGDTDRLQLRRQLELLCTCQVRPGFAAIKGVWKPGNSIATWQEQVLSHRRFHRQWLDLFTGGDPRLDPVPPGLMESDSTQVNDWLLPVLRTDRVCVTIAGDFEPQEALRHVAATFGTLSEREAWTEPNPFPPVALASPGLHRLPVKPESDQILAAIGFPLGAPANPEEALHHRLLAEVFDLRVRAVIREDLGESYSARALLWSPVTSGTNWVIALVPCATGRTDEVGEVLIFLTDDLLRGNWSADEFGRAAIPLAHDHRKTFRSPASALRAMQAPGQVPSPRMLEPSSILPMEPSVKALARRVLDQKNLVELRIDGEK